MEKIAEYVCREKVDRRGRHNRRGIHTCGYSFSGMLPSEVKYATGRGVNCPQCGGIPNLVNIIERE